MPPKNNVVQFRETQKFNLWAKYFTDKNDRDCYLNATKSAIKAYGYSSPGQYHLASVTGSKNMRKYEFLASSTLDMMGFGFGDLLKIGIKKVLEGSYKDWDAFMERVGYFEEKGKIQQNNHFNQFNFENIQEAIIQARTERGLTP